MVILVTAVALFAIGMMILILENSSLKKIIIDWEDTAILRRDLFVRGTYAICPECKQKIYSLHRHDFKKCKCDGVFIDGGPCYLRVGGKQFANPELILGKVYETRYDT